MSAQIALPQNPKQQRLAGNMDTSLLKIIALLSMIVDHVGYTMFPDIACLRVIGRIAMPLYAWCIVVGSSYTHNIWKYALRLFLLGLISQPFYIMAIGVYDFNILFQFALDVLVIAGIQKKRWYSQFWAPVLALGVLYILPTVDYGRLGLVFVLLLYLSRKHKLAIVLAVLAAAVAWSFFSSPVYGCFGMSSQFFYDSPLSPVLSLFFKQQSLIWLSLPLILIPMRSGIKMPKWMGYGLYPIHLIILIGVQLIFGRPFQDVISALLNMFHLN